MNKFVIVKEIVDEWDPVNLLHTAPSDEYEGEIKEILNRLQKVKSTEELAVVIHDVFVRCFGKDLSDASYYSVSECLPIAKKIWNRLDRD